MLDIEGLQVEYGGYQVLWGVDIKVQQGEVVCVLGPNGAGKSTVMNAISGVAKAKAGKIMFRGTQIEALPTHQIVGLGIAHVLERQRVFPHLSVAENLQIGSFQHEARKRRAETLAQVLDMFPILADRRKQMAHSLSGGEQQQLAIARGLMSCPAFVMLDEPFLGLAPNMVEQIVDTILRLQSAGLTILFIEQNVEQALAISDRAYILESGRVAITGTRDELLAHERMREVYLGTI